MTPKHILDVDVTIDREAVWNLITDAPLFHGLRIPCIYDEFDRDTAKPGTKFMAQSLFGGGKYPVYIVDWEPQKRFSFGPSAFDWTFCWELVDSDGGTHVRFQRKFRNLSKIGGIIDFLRGGPYLKEQLRLIDDTVASLSGACTRLSQGESHGITPSP